MFLKYPCMFLACTAGEQGPYAVTCKTVDIPGLYNVTDGNERLQGYSSARVCFPMGKGTFPLHVFCHGDMAGGPFFTGYEKLQEQIASFGFVVPAYLPCYLSGWCDDGNDSILIALMVLGFFEQNPGVAPVNLLQPYSVSGHSTGGRIAGMLASLRDSPSYLAGTKLASRITPSMRVSLSKILAVIASHPDPYYNLPGGQVPFDVQHFNVTKMPVLIITGSADDVEPDRSGWKDFRLLRTPDKVFINIRDASHIQVFSTHEEGPFIAYFAQYFAMGNASAGKMIYGSGVGSLQHLPLAQPGDKNNGDDDIAFLACRQNGTAVPEKHVQYCTRT